jgi:hypothetical protein
VPAYELPEPANWITGDLISAPALRQQVSNTVGFLTGVPMFVGTQQTTSQALTNATGTAVTIDTEYWDNYNGHLVGTDGNTYYAMVAGWYMVESHVPLSYSGTTGTVSAGMTANSNGTVATGWGQRVNNCAAESVAVSVHLTEMVNVGTFGSGDYIQAYAYQNEGATQDLRNYLTGPISVPYLKAKWICANTGQANLALPTNPNWPSPPTYITSAFLNTNIQQTIQFLAYPPILEWHYNAGSANLASQTTLPTGAGTLLGFDTEIVDNYGAYNTGTHLWTAPVAGTYYCYGQVGITTGAGGQAMAAGLTVTSSNYFGGTTATIWGGCQSTAASTNYAAIVRRKLRFNAGDTVNLAGFQHDSGAASAVVEGTTSWGTRMIIVWVSA